MSRHWNPDDELARVAEATPWTLAESYLLPAGRHWSDQAKAAVVLLMGACVFLAAGFFQAL
jgi:hypothetical protein